ncbi:unnamed protein product [marine sediment metagenome]|uniref:Transporter-associated domain-containing protein n=1 Tax=marine sediment metagenome TaxID=412755 RepID=X1HII3_9ZZZZ
MKNKVAYVNEILKFSEKSAAEVLIPVNFLPYITDINSQTKILQCLEEKKSRYILLFDKEKKELQGYIDILKIMHNLTQIANHITKPHFILESRPLFDIINDIKANSLELIFTIDEYGSVSGVISKEDIFEEFIGEFLRKEEDEVYYIKKINEKQYIVKGYIDIDYLNKILNINIKKKKFNTIAGFLINQTGRIMQEGEKYKHKNIVFEILTAKPNKIEKIKITGERIKKCAE